MKRLMKALSAMLCLAMLVSGVPADMLFAAVYAEEVSVALAPDAAEGEAPEAAADVEISAEEPAVAEESIEVPAQEPEAEEISEAVDADDSESLPAEEESSEDAPVIEEDPNAIDYGADASESKAFSVGFAEVLKADMPVYEDQDAGAAVKLALSKGVVYVTGRSEKEPDRLEIAFNAGPEIGIGRGWVDAARVRPMEPDQEVPAYIAFCSDFEDIIYYKDDAKLPLVRIGCTYPEAVQPEATATSVPPAGEVQTPAPVATEHPAVEMPLPEETEHPVVEVPALEETEHPVVEMPLPEETEHPVVEMPAPEEPETETAQDAQPTESAQELFTEEFDAETLAATGEEQIKLSVGMKQQLEYTAPQKGSYTFTSSDAKVATVNAEGMVTARMAGETTIRLKVDGVTQISWTANVLAAPAVALSRTSCKLGVGDTFSLSQIVSANPNDTPATYTYKVKSGASYASVNASTGLVKAKSAGTATIRVTNNGGKYKDFTVKVYKAATKVSKFEIADSTLGVGMTTKLTLTFPSSTYLDFTLESSDEKVATVASDGTVTAVAKGKATISFVPTNSAKSSLTKSVTLTVLPGPTKIALKASKSSNAYGVGEKNASVTASCDSSAMCSFTYSSSDTDVATVNKTTGALTLKAKGTVQITAKASNSNATASVTLTVSPKPTKIAFAVSTLKLGKGDTYQLTETDKDGIIKLTPSDAGASYTYKVTSGSQYASISKAGLITAKKAGSATIRVYTQDTKIYKDLKVKVYAAATKVKLSSSALTMGTNMERALTVSFDKTTTFAAYKFTSSNENVVSVDSLGNLTSHNKTGKATITVETTAKGLKATCTVTVLPAPNTIAIKASKSSLVYGVGEKDATVTASCASTSMCDFTYTSSDTSVATVDKTTGALTLVKKGTAKITAKASNSDATDSVTITVRPKPTKIAFSVSTLKMGKGDTYQLTETDNEGIIKLTPDDACASYTYKVTSGSQYASISKSGLITAKKAGSATIRVYTQNTKVYKDLKVKVYAAPASVKVSAPEMMGVGMTDKLSLTFDKTTTYSICTFESSKPKVVSVDATGAIEALSEGTAKITVTTQNNKTASCTIEVLPAPEKVSVKAEAYTISVGMTQSIADDVKIPSGSMTSYTYTTSNKSVATVDANGNVKGVKKGSATITVKTHNGETASVKVSVTAAPSKIKFVGLPKQLNISMGDVITIPTPVAYDASGNEIPATFTYKTSDKSIVKVSGDKMAGVKKSSTVVTITATSHNKKTATFKVRVYADAVSGIELPYDSYQLYVSGDCTDSVELGGTASGTNINYGSITYKSSNTKVATVSDSGIVTGLTTGSATITATTKDGAKTTCKITVGKLSSKMTVAESEDGLLMGEGETYTLKPKFDSGTGSRVTYKSSNTKKVTVDESGNLKAIASGSATITVEGQNGLKSTVEVTVLYSPTSITLPAGELYMKPGEEVTLSPVLTASVTSMKKVNTALSYDASKVNSKVVSIKDDGKGNYKVKALAKGSTTLTLTTCNGLTASCKITVSSTTPTLGFPADWADKVAIVVGDSASLNLALSAQALNEGYEIVSSKASALKVSDDNQTIVAAAAASSVTLTLKVGGEEVDERVVQVVASAKPAFKVNGSTVSGSVNMDISSFTANNAKHDIVLSSMPKYPLIGTFEMSYDTDILGSYSWANQKISTKAKTGTTKLYVKTYSGEATLEVNVLGAPVYRALLMSEYNNSGDKNDLPFAQTNIDYMKAALEQSNIDGRKYQIATPLKNPTQEQIKNGLANTFQNAKENDVSFIYLVAHGHLNKTSVNGSSTFYFSMPNYSTKKASTMITDDELMSGISKIKGYVVLVMCNCHSGEFIKHQKKKLASAGNIAVLTAQTSEKTASFYVNYKGISTHEFFTRAVYTALGNPQNVGSGDPWNNAVNADLASGGNGDGYISISEAFNYARELTHAMVNRYCTTEYFVAGKNVGFTSPGLSTNAKALAWRKASNGYGQDPQMYIPAGMKDLAIIGY